MATMEPGTVIHDRYVVSRVLGRGSFGTTYAARNLDDDALVAVKVLDLRRVDDWKAVELFEREARVLASLDHPQIPRYIDFVPLAEDHSALLVQALAPGRSLEARLADGQRFDEDRVRYIAAQLLEILVYLAGRLPPVIHRDIKPGNILLSDDDRCYLVDFGSVRDAVEAERSGGSTVAGTFGYMAPEQLHGAANPSSDLYGLGMTLVHLLTGTAPSELERRRLKVDYRADIQISDGLAAFVDRLIEPMQEDRYPNPAAATRALASAGGLQADLSLDSSDEIDQSSALYLRSLLEPSEGDDIMSVLNLGQQSSSSGATLPALSGEAIAATLARRKQEAEHLAQVEEAAAAERRLAVAARSQPRVTLVDDSEGFTVVVQPLPLTRRLLVQSPIALFIAINPGFAIVGGFPFLGRMWPVFADFFVGRLIVWILVLAAVNIYIAKRRDPVLNLRVTGGHFALWTHDPEAPLAIGPIQQLRIQARDTDSDGYGQGSIGSQNFHRLTARDLEVLERARERIEAMSKT